MIAADRHRGRPRAARRGAGLAAAAAIAGCVGARSAPTLPPAGAHDDDGAGQLAQASVQIRLGDGATDIDAERDRRRAAAARHYRGRSSSFSSGLGYGTDPSLGGSVYGLDTSVGGVMYGGFGFGRSGFGIAPTLPPRTDGGKAAIVGAVTWRGDRGVAWPVGCAGARVARGGGGATGAVVYLANAPLRRDQFDEERWTTTRGAIAADGCALWPPVQVIGPLPGLVEVENGGGAPIELGVAGGPAPLTLEPGGSWRFMVTDVPPVRIDAGGHAPAWLLGQTHDYHTVTDSLGRFVIDDVPAGTYELVVWYPPLVRSIEGDRPVWTEATTTRRRITVGSSGAVRVSLALDPAP